MFRSKYFSNSACYIAQFSGGPSTSILAFLIILTWIISCPLFSFSDTWQLVITTGASIVTCLIVFIIQNTQNRGGEAVRIKFDEIIPALESAPLGTVIRDCTFHGTILLIINFTAKFFPLKII